MRAIWRDSFDRGDIAGPYWALMSHPGSPPALIRDIFGEVHMLSHLVGSASRLDIARLTRLENELEQERDKTDRQQARLKGAADERISLQYRLRQVEERAIQAEAIVALSTPRAWTDPDQSGSGMVEMKRDAAISQRLAEAEEKRDALERELEQLRDLNHAILRENEALEATIAAQFKVDMDRAFPQLAEPVLYVGGRRNLFDHLRACAENRKVNLLLHDGGMEDSTTLLPALVGQAATILFPVDHISHTAVGLVKLPMPQSRTSSISPCDRPALQAFLRRSRAQAALRQAVSSGCHSVAVSLRGRQPAGSGGAKAPKRAMSMFRRPGTEGRLRLLPRHSPA